MIDTIRSALSRILPGHHGHEAQPQPPRKSPRDTFSTYGRPRAPYDPHASRARAGLASHPILQRSRKPVHAPAESAVTPEKLAASYAVLQAMQLEAQLARLLVSASCPEALWEDPLVREVQGVAIEECFGTFSSMVSEMEEAARDLCLEFSSENLAALASFAGTEAGIALFSLVPQLRLSLKYDWTLGPERKTGLCEEDQRDLLACLRRFDTRLPEILGGRSENVMRQAWTRPFTADVISDIATFLRRPQGRAFVDYAQRACWLGVPQALVLSRETWVKAVQSDMVTLLQHHGEPVPAPYDAMPMYVRSHVEIEDLTARA